MSNNCDAVKVNVIFFAKSRELVGCSTSSVTLPSSISSADLLSQVITHFPRLNELAGCFTLSLNEEYIDKTDLSSLHLRENDEIAVIPPISGG